MIEFESAVKEFAGIQSKVSCQVIARQNHYKSWHPMTQINGKNLQTNGCIL
jgi:hypothetical protein